VVESDRDACGGVLVRLGFVGDRDFDLDTTLAFDSVSLVGPIGDGSTCN